MIDYIHHRDTEVTEKTGEKGVVAETIEARG